VQGRHSNGAFNFQRPSKQLFKSCHFSDVKGYETYANFWYTENMLDDTGFVGIPESVNRWVFSGDRLFKHQLGRVYTKHKLVLYDQTTILTRDDETINRVVDSWKKEYNIAFIESESGVFKRGRHVTSKPLYIQENDLNVRVAAFNANELRLETHLEDEKFLVYNDAYSKNWKVFIDGQESELLRTNVSFKGVWVPKGHHTVEFKYITPGGQWIFILDLMLAAIILLCMLRFMNKENNYPWTMETR